MKDRLQELPVSDTGENSAATTSVSSDSRDAWLSPFELSEAADSGDVPAARASNKDCLPMTFAEYLQLLDWTGRQVREDKRGAIPHDLAPVFERSVSRRRAQSGVAPAFRCCAARGQ